MNFKDTIGIFPNAFSESECEALIYKSEEAVKLGTAWEGQAGDREFRGKELNEGNEFKKSTDCQIDMRGSLASLVAARFNKYTNTYLNDFPHNATFDHNMVVDNKANYPMLQIQKYDKGSGHYNSWHVEISDAETALRQFVYILYLNTVDEGGETGFLFKEEGSDDFFKVKPSAGKLIIHPANWPYIHKGYMPITQDKYILTTWLQYIP
mgnify:CR=1 FL=1